MSCFHQISAPSEAPTRVGVKVLSSSEISVHWEHVVEKIVESYQVSSIFIKLNTCIDK